MLVLDKSRSTGPLDSYVYEVKTSLLAQGYVPLSVRNRVNWMKKLSQWMLQKGVAPAEFKERHLIQFVRSRRRFDRRFSRGWLKSVLDILVERRVIKPFPRPRKKAPNAVARIIQPFEVYLREERGLTIFSQYTSIVQQFLMFRFSSQVPLVRNVTADDLVRFILHYSRLYSTGSTKLAVSALRSYFRFLHTSDTIPHDLSGAIPAIAGWRFSNVPRGISSDMLKRLLQSPDRRTAMGRRDYAILLLLARLGLRRIEVVRLQLDDIDWKNGELRIRGKRNREDRLPLPIEVGDALAAHLKKGSRRTNSRSVFCGVRPPFRPITGGIAAIVRSAADRAGLSVTAHQLRHTLATQTLKQGGSLDEIAQVLRHSSHNTTAIYAKVDLLALNEVTLPWPGSGRVSHEGARS